MGYVALSRLQSLEGLYLGGWNDIALQVNPYILEIDKEFKKQATEFIKSVNYL